MARNRMAHSNRVPLRRRQLEERRREHTLARLSTLDKAQMLARPPLLQAVSQHQAQAHSDTLPKHNSLPMVCRNSQHMDSQATQIQRRNSRPQHTASLHTANPLAMRLPRPDTLSSPHLEQLSRVFRV
jgi:hypothetical protein